MKLLCTVCLFISIVVLFAACKKGVIDPFYKQLVFLAEYNKPTYVAGTFKVDEASLPKQIIVPANQFNTNAVTCNSTRQCMTISNVRLRDELGIYNIKDATDIVTQEWRNDEWVQDVENKLSLQKAQKLDIVLVLDFSSSLGNDIAKVKEYALSFIDYIEDNHSQAKIGVVIFSNSPIVRSLSNNYNIARTVINGTPAGADETRLYEAMDAGITLFQNSAAEGRALVTFTDGKNNAWSNPIYQKYETVQDKLKIPTGNPAMLIPSYTIGLNGKQGGVDASALNILAMNGGISAVAPDTDQLSKIFQKFASSVSAVYTMTYNRNSSIISNVKLRFLLNTQLQ